MGFHGHFVLCFLVLVAQTVNTHEAFSYSYHGVSIDPRSEPLDPGFGIDILNRSSFPKGFVFGAASSAYQVEGAWDEGGAGPSIWDTFTHRFPEKIKDHGNGDVACDSYHRYKEDAEILKDLNFDAYRFSISWPRVIPSGKISGGINEEGVKYYNDLIDELLANGISPHVTLFHWDLPQVLEDEYGGFLSPQILKDFRGYAALCFKRFGDRVKHWTTINEPWSYSNGGYVYGKFAPGRCSSWLNPNCTGGNSSTEPYLVTHYQLLAHAIVVKLYKEKYQKIQNGSIGITLIASWMVPFSNSTLDHHAARRALDFTLGWCLEPLTSGDYPHTMRSLVGERLPRFTKEQAEMVKGSYDFLGLNYYTAFYAAHLSNSDMINVSYITDSLVNLTVERNGVPIGEQGGSAWLHVYPRGIWELLLYIKRHYNSPPIYITENGIDEVNNASIPIKDALADSFRIKYYHKHLSFVRMAMEDGANVMAYFAWSIMDNFEWADGYTVRFGINFVDFNDGLKRYSKLSAKWFKTFLRN